MFIEAGEVAGDMDMAYLCRVYQLMMTKRVGKDWRGIIVRF